MAYKDQSHWAAPLEVAEQNNLYSTFNSLRKAVAYSNPHRGVLLKSYFSEDVVQRTNALAHGKQYDHALVPLHHSKSPKKHDREAVRYAYDEHGHRIVVSNPLTTTLQGGADVGTLSSATSNAMGIGMVTGDAARQNDRRGRR